MSPQEAYGQSRFDDKKLKTSKKPKRDNRKSFFRMENRENAPPTKVEVRTTQRKTKRKDKRTLIGPVGKDQTQNYDFKLRDVEQPYRPEISYEGFRKAKRNNRAPNLNATTYSGELKSSSLSTNPGRTATNTQRQKGKSKKTKERSYKNLSQQVQQYSGDMKNAAVPVSHGRDISNAGNMRKGRSQRSSNQDFRSRSMEMHQFSGFQKVQSPGGPSRGSHFQGDRRAASSATQEKRMKARSKQVHQYSGDLKYSSLSKGKGRDIAQASAMSKGKSQKRKKDDLQASSRQMHQYQGNIKVPSLSSRTKHLRKLSQKVNQYEGNIRIRNLKHKDLHPSVSYLKGKQKSSHDQKEKLRKRKINWFRFWRNSDQPTSVKQKPTKPKYDSRESEIWYD